MNDQADRLLIRHGLDETVIVEAAAGTGKTTELVARILNVLAVGRARIDQIVAVTFTEKAAGELKLRIRQELETARQRAGDPAAQSNLTDAIQRLEEAHVSTIHGFCADLLRERPVEAGVDPLFDVLTEPRAERLFADAFRGWLHERLEDPPAGVRRALRRSVWSPDGRDRADGPIDRLRRAARELAEWRDFDGAWRRDPFDRDAALGRGMARVREFAALSGSPGSERDPLFLDTRPIREFAHEIETVMRDGIPDYDGWEARAIDLAQNRNLRRARRGRERAYGGDTARDAVWAAYEAVMNELDEFQCAADADLAALLRAELAGALTQYEHLKRRAGALDFVDLLLRARDLLAGHPQVRRAFQSRFTHVFVDEFQDTDPLQAEILLLLAADDPAGRDWRARDAGAGKTVSRRRSQTGDLSIPSRRRRNVSGGPRPARGSRRQARVPAYEFSGDATHPARRQRRLRAGHGRQPRHSPSAVRRAVHAPARIGRAAVGRRPAGARAVRSAPSRRVRD